MRAVGKANKGIKASIGAWAKRVGTEHNRKILNVRNRYKQVSVKKKSLKLDVCIHCIICMSIKILKKRDCCSPITIGYMPSSLHPYVPVRTYILYDNRF